MIIFKCTFFLDFYFPNINIVRRWFSLRDEKSTHTHGNGELELTLEWVHDTFVARSDSFLRGQRGENGDMGILNSGPRTLKKSKSLARSSSEQTESNCFLCACSFVLHRKRHCRMCLRAVCVSCSDRLFLPGFSEAKRVCTACCNLQIMLHRKGANMGSRQDNPALAEASRNVERMQTREQARETEPIQPLTIDDFDLLKVVGKGAFGKVII